MTVLDTLCTELLCISLAQRRLPLTITLSDEVWLALPAYAARNRVGALLFDAIALLPSDIKVPRKTVLALALQAAESEKSDGRRRAAWRQLEQLAGERYAVLKGFALASLYPHPAHREATDVDLFCGERTAALAALLQQQGIACDSKNPRHLTFVLHGVLFEAHQYLFYNAQDRHLFADWEQRAADKLSLAQHALFFLAHTAYDAVYFDIPISWRTCCDWLLLLQRLHASPAERHSFEQRLHGASFEQFAAAFTRSCRLLFPTLAEGITYYNIAAGTTAPMPARCRFRNAFYRDTFWKMFRNPRPRHATALLRVAYRAGKYLRYNRYYKALFGQNMFRAFYLHNLWVALWQRRHGHTA